MSMEEKVHTIVVHNKLPLKSNTIVTTIEVWKNTEPESYSATMIDIPPEKSEQITKKLTNGITELTIRIDGNNRYNPMAVAIKIKKEREDIYVSSASKKCEEVTISNSTQKLITLYAINKKQKQLNNK